MQIFSTKFFVDGKKRGLLRLLRVEVVEIVEGGNSRLWAEERHSIGIKYLATNVGLLQMLGFSEANGSLLTAVYKCWASPKPFKLLICMSYHPQHSQPSTFSTLNILNHLNPQQPQPFPAIHSRKISSTLPFSAQFSSMFSRRRIWLNRRF